jgi:hypothetical protein
MAPPGFVFLTARCAVHTQRADFLDFRPVMARALPAVSRRSYADALSAAGCHDREGIEFRVVQVWSGCRKRSQQSRRSISILCPPLCANDE